MNCEAYVTRCRKCGFYFGNRTFQTYPECPECKTPREPCKRQAVNGYRFCQYHGGPNPKNNFYGKGGGMIVTGKGSNFPLTRLAAKYMQMKEDARLLSNRASIEVIRDRIMELARRIDVNDAPERMTNLKNLWEEFKVSRGTAEEIPARKAMDEEFERAYHDYASWKQMFDAIDLDRKLVESEVKIVKDMHAVLTAEDAYELTAQLLAAIISTINSMDEIPDNVKLQFLKRIQYEFTRVVGDRIKQGPRGSGEEDRAPESGDMDRDELLHPGDEE